MFSNFVSRLREAAAHINKQFSGPEPTVVDVSGIVLDVSGTAVDVSGTVVDVSGTIVDVSGANLILTTGDTCPPIDMSGRRMGFDFSDTTSYDISGLNISWTTGVSGERVFLGNTTTYFGEPACYATNQTVMYTGGWTNTYDSLNTTFITNFTTSAGLQSSACEFDSSTCGCVCPTDALDCSGGVCVVKPVAVAAATSAPAVEKDCCDGGVCPVKPVAVAPAVENSLCSNIANCSTSCPQYEVCQKKQARVACDSDACGTGAGCGTGGGCSCKKSNLIEYD